MPVEVIDLLSSSSPPRAPIVWPKDNYKSPKKALTGRTHVIASGIPHVATKTNVCERTEKSKDSRQTFTKEQRSTDNGKVQEWIDLDDETILTYPAAVAEKSPNGPLNSGKDGGNKLPPPKPAETRYGELRFTSTVDISSKGAHSDFMYLSDDFDSSINLDKDYSLPSDLQLPPNKKRRGTPELETFEQRPRPLKDNGFRRVASDITAVSAYSRSTAGPPKAGGLKRSATMVIDDDPITFTSSPDFLQQAEEMRRKRRQEAERGKILSNAEESGPENNRKHTILDVIDDNSDLDLPDIGVMASQIALGSAPTLARHKSEKALATYKASKASSSKQATNPQEKPKRVFKSAEEKQAEKEAEAERKRLIREDKARDKQIAADLAKVNTLRTDKKISTPEMIAVFPTDLDEKLRKQAEGFLGKIGVEYEEWESHGAVKNVLRWKRKVDAKYNERDGHWEPVPTEIEEEKHVLCYITASEFVALGTHGEGQEDLDAHVRSMKSRFGMHEIIYLIEGLNSWMRKNRNVRNRQFTDAVRQQMGEEDGGTNSRRARKNAAEYVDEDMIEDALLRLQVIHNVLIHHTNSLVETAEWIAVFTQHISTIPYRRQRMALDTAFCMETGQIKTGEDAPDTYVRMLQEINRITAPIAYGIAAEYPSVKALVDGLREEGKDALTHVRKSANKDGAFSDREVGKSVSKRVWSIFMGKDEGSTDV